MTASKWFSVVSLICLAILVVYVVASAAEGDPTEDSSVSGDQPPRRRFLSSDASRVRSARRRRIRVGGGRHSNGLRRRKLRLLRRGESGLRKEATAGASKNDLLKARRNPDDLPLIHPGRTAQLQQAERNISNEDLNPESRFNNLFSVFTIVRFQNLPCATTNGNGTCYTAKECANLTGNPMGPCAKGFGVCCSFVSSCGSSSNKNNTIFTNPNFPSAELHTLSCQITIRKMSENICQLRLDFNQFSIALPDTTSHKCEKDQFIVSGGSPISTICGVNTGNHMYVDLGLGNNNPAILTVVLNGNEESRMWAIKVAQIPCNSVLMAPDGCLQYHMGVRGQVKTFNYDSVTDGATQLSDQMYTICIRSELNFCGIGYSTCADPDHTPSHAFSITGTAGTGNSKITDCNTDWVTIPCLRETGGTNCYDRICGAAFNVDNNNSDQTLYSNVKPFRIIYRTDSNEDSDTNNRGFCLDYLQLPCTV